MPAENPSGNPERRIIDSIKQRVKDSRVFELTDGVRRESAAGDVLRSVGITGIDDLQDLLDKRRDPNINQDAFGKRLDFLGVAIGEVIMESGNEDLKTAVMAGPFSLEAKIPKSWIVKGDKYSGNDSLAGVIADGVVRSTITEKNRDVVTKVMLMVDFYKNNPQYGDLLGSQIEFGINELQRIMSPLNRLEMSALSDRLKYLLNLRGGISQPRTSTNSSDTNSSGERPRRNRRYDVMEAIEEEDDPDVLRDIARVQLDKIEEREDLSNRYRLEGQPTYVLDEITFRLRNELINGAKAKLGSFSGSLEERKKLEERLKKYELLRKEIQARLTIFDIGKLMSDAAYKLSDRGGITDVIGQAANNNRIMDREVMGFLFKESKEVGIDIATAWDWIQDANFKYEEVLKKMKNDGWDKKYHGTSPFDEVDDSIVIDRRTGKRKKIGLFLDKDGNPERAALVEEYILSKLGGDRLTGTNAKKAYQLANELVSATAERSVFNFTLIKADTFADVIYFKAMRDDDARKGKNVGPVASRNIDSLAHGWLRYFSRSNDLTDEMDAIYAKDIKIEEIIGKQDSVGYFCKVLPAYVLNIKNALMDSDPDLKKVLNLSYLQGLVSAFDKVDIPYKIAKNAKGEWVRSKDGKDKSRCGVYNMKPLYALGILELLVTKENLGVDTRSMTRLRELFVETNLSDTAKPFLSEAQWRWCLEQKIAYIGDRNLTFVEAMRVNRKSHFIDSFWSYFLDGGKLKK